MPLSRILATVLLLLVPLNLTPLHGQASPPIDHAKRVFDLFRQDKFDEVAAELSGQLAAITASQLREGWRALQQQAGDFTSFIDERVTTPGPGITAVSLGCQFEKTAVNFVVAFDAENKIGGLRFAPRPVPQVPAKPTSTRFTEEAVTVGSGEWSLPGTLSVPVGPIAGAIVLVHGSGPQDRDVTFGPNKPFRDLAWGLADRGIAVLRYEKRTKQHGAKIAGLKDFTVREETTDDALLAVAVLRNHARIDPARVFVLGLSLGGGMAPRIAAADPRLAGIVIMAGPTRPLPELMREQFAYLSSLSGGPSDPEAAIQQALKLAPESYWKDLEGYRPAEVAAKLTLPMLILQGERDYQVTLTDLQGWRASLAGKPAVTIKSYPALNHMFLPGEGKSTPSEYQRPGHVPVEVLDDISKWVGLAPKG